MTQQEYEFNLVMLGFVKGACLSATSMYIFYNHNLFPCSAVIDRAAGASDSPKDGEDLPFDKALERIQEELKDATNT